MSFGIRVSNSYATQLHDRRNSVDNKSSGSNLTIYPIDKDKIRIKIIIFIKGIRLVTILQNIRFLNSIF